MSDERRSFFQSRSGLVLLGFLAVAGFFLWTEHRAHVVAGLWYLPWLLLLACPLMHLFHGHGHGDDDGKTGNDHSRHDQNKKKSGDDAP